MRGHAALMLDELALPLVVAAVLLSLERFTYAWVWHGPERFVALCARAPRWSSGDPVAGLSRLFHGFKILQLGVFLGWCWHFSGGDLGGVARLSVPAGLGALLLAAGQTLNVAVLWRLGRLGVFYGDRFGHAIPWRTDFPFSLLPHPQYTGAVLSIWGFFLIARFPHPDWFALPLLETLYYALGAFAERQPASAMRRSAWAP